MTYRILYASGNVGNSYGSGVVAHDIARRVAGKRDTNRPVAIIRVRPK